MGKDVNISGLKMIQKADSFRSRTNNDADSDSEGAVKSGKARGASLLDKHEDTTR